MCTWSASGAASSRKEVYRHAYETVSEAGKGIADYLRYFNEERPHQGLDNRTPDGRILQTKTAAQSGITRRDSTLKNAKKLSSFFGTISQILLITMVLLVPNNKTEDDYKQWGEKIGMPSELGVHLQVGISYSDRPGPPHVVAEGIVGVPRPPEDDLERTMLAQKLADLVESPDIAIFVFSGLMRWRVSPRWSF